MRGISGLLPFLSEAEEIRRYRLQIPNDRCLIREEDYQGGEYGVERAEEFYRVLPLDIYIPVTNDINKIKRWVQSRESDVTVVEVDYRGIAEKLTLKGKSAYLEVSNGVVERPVRNTAWIETAKEGMVLEEMPLLDLSEDVFDSARVEDLFSKSSDLKGLELDLELGRPVVVVSPPFDFKEALKTKGYRVVDSSSLDFCYATLSEIVMKLQEDSTLLYIEELEEASDAVLYFLKKWIESREYCGVMLPLLRVVARTNYNFLSKELQAVSKRMDTVALYDSDIVKLLKVVVDRKGIRDNNLNDYLLMRGPYNLKRYQALSTALKKSNEIPEKLVEGLYMDQATMIMNDLIKRGWKFIKGELNPFDMLMWTDGKAGAIFGGDLLYRCVTGENLVEVDGKIKCIRDVVGEVAGNNWGYINGEGSIESLTKDETSFVQVYRDEAQEEYRVGGKEFEIIGTPEHRLLTSSFEWKRMEDIEKGDKVLAPLPNYDVETFRSTRVFRNRGEKAFGIEAGNISKQEVYEYLFGLVYTRGRVNGRNLEIIRELSDELELDKLLRLLNQVGLFPIKESNYLKFSSEETRWILSREVSYYNRSDYEVWLRFGDESFKGEKYRELEVTSVNQILDTREVFDLVVPKGRSFVCNGVWSHNTARLENEMTGYRVIRMPRVSKGIKLVDREIGKVEVETLGSRLEREFEVLSTRNEPVILIVDECDYEVVRKKAEEELTKCIVVRISSQWEEVFSEDNISVNDLKTEIVKKMIKEIWGVHREKSVDEIRRLDRWIFRNQEIFNKKLFRDLETFDIKDWIGSLIPQWEIEGAYSKQVLTNEDIQEKYSKEGNSDKMLALIYSKEDWVVSLIILMVNALFPGMGDIVVRMMQSGGLK